MIINRNKELKYLKATGPLLIMLPFAGGHAHSYSSIVRYLPSSLDVFCPELPGRGVESEYPLLNNIEQLAEYLFESSFRRLDLERQYVLFGHSMGALLAYLLSHKIRKAGFSMPAHLLVCGRGGPAWKKKVKDEEMPIHEMPSQQFREKLREMGGTPEEVLGDDQLMDYFEPIIRSDFAAVASYQYQRAPALEVGITVIYGDQETNVELSAHLWEQETCRSFSSIRLQGDHFFIFHHSLEIASYLASLLQVKSENELYLFH